MIHRPYESRMGRATQTPTRPWLSLVGVALLIVAGCTGTTPSPSPTASGVVTTAEPTSEASGAAACIDAETAAIIQALRAPGADVETIITEQGDKLVAGLQRFTPPPDATTWRDELVAAIEDGDAAAVQAQVEMIGSEVTLQFC
jgi:hypothetical protein